MQLKDKVVFVTGANRGLGKASVRAFLDAVVAKVYAAGRRPPEGLDARVEWIELDVTDFGGIENAAIRCRDVDLVINNAGVLEAGSLTSSDSIDIARRHIEVNVLGLLAVSKAFAPVLKLNGGGGIVNILSGVSWFSLPGKSAYSASKSAAWGISNGLRQELYSQGTFVLNVHPGYIDTDMASDVDGMKTTPDDVAHAVLHGIEAEQKEILVGDGPRKIKQSLSSVEPAYLMPHF
ncbi:SDR family NAD(P)-dependent oxidoreductase [Cupriavidus necator]|uniref:SDR family NAD(P)-dependent oxidoreductase n=1 Tax=Cupriavidus necator TaxID=106590 RepID=A0A367PFZ8_CUPNE|nr:SDR family NAD(P)-dependent oxidoreductase [Cupriavidus necator]QQX86605.1 SDR family NAD(P)-dependent oxidoreductase [Cupriavidus necator]RCJ06800.1 SDR family NAD(P)-dependent oxidoreductase [Cupriavidus necator]